MTAKHPTWTRVGDLRFDESYQRIDKIVTARVTDIAKNFDEGALGVILVSERDNGDLYVIDGMHRVLGTMKRFGADYRIPAMLYQGMTIEDEARAFWMQTKRTAISAISEHKARVVANEAMAVCIQEVLDRNGLTTTKRGQTTNNGKRFYAVRTLEKIYKESGCEAVDFVVETVIAGTKPIGVEASGDLVDAVYGVLIRYPNVDADTISRTITNRGAAYIRNRALALRKMGITRELAEVQALVDAINHGRRNRLSSVMTTKRAKRLTFS